MLNNFSGKNSILYMVENDVNDSGYQAASDFIKDLVLPKDFKRVLLQIEKMKNDINKFNQLTSNKPIASKRPLTSKVTKVEAATEYKEGTGMKVINGYGLKQNEKVVNNKYYVNEDLLKNNGILEIRYVKNRHLAHVRPSTLSEKCKGCVLDMINGGKVNADNFVSLNQFEKDLLRKIEKLFQTGQSLNDDDDNNFTKNFELLKGSYLAGNDNQTLKDQLRKYITHAHEIGKLTKWNANKMLFDLKLI
jgi:hypothetical protein